MIHYRPYEDAPIDCLFYLDREATTTDETEVTCPECQAVTGSWLVY